MQIWESISDKNTWYQQMTSSEIPFQNKKTHGDYQGLPIHSNQGTS